MTGRILSLLAIAAMGAAELASDAEFDKITQFLSALDAEVEEDSHRKLYSMDYGDDGSTETSTPTPAPTMVYYVAASISMTGITCDDYGDDEETAVKAGVASIMDGVEVAATLGHEGAVTAAQLKNNGSCA